METEYEEFVQKYIDEFIDIKPPVVDPKQAKK